MRLENFNDRAVTYADQKTALVSELNNAGLAAYADTLLAVARPAALFVPTPTSDAQIAVASSKIGGWPDLPPNVEWPTADEVLFRSWNDFEVCGTFPIPFLVQINLNDLSGAELDIPLPQHGLLSVFRGADEHEVFGQRFEGVRPCWRVLYSEDPSLTLRRRPSTEPAVVGMPFLAQRLFVQQITTLPDLFESPLGPISFDEGVDAMLAFRFREFVPNAVRVGGWAYSAGNGEPLGTHGERRKLHQVGEDVGVELEVRRAEGWCHLLSMDSRDFWDEFPDQGILHSDYTSPSFGADGVMSVYLQPGDNESWLDPHVLAEAVAPTGR